MVQNGLQFCFSDGAAVAVRAIKAKQRKTNTAFIFKRCDPLEPPCCPGTHPSRSGSGSGSAPARR